MLDVRKLCHHYGKVQVLHDLDFSVNQGEIVGLLGPNGAGKSTTMRILTGYYTPSSGDVLFDGQDIRKDILRIRRQLGYMPEDVPLYPELKVQEYLLWAARIKESVNPARQVGEVLERCGLDKVKNKLIRFLSKGYRQRVGLAQCILGEPRLLILDEPTVGLDPTQIREIRSLIKELGKERTIFLSTHILPEVEKTCDRALIIDKGRIIAEDTPAGLVAAFGGKGRFLLKLDVATDLLGDVLAAYRKIPGVTSAELGDNSEIVLETSPEKDIRAELTSLAFQSGWPLVEFKPANVSLEEVFVSLVREENQGVAA